MKPICLAAAGLASLCLVAWPVPAAEPAPAAAAASAGVPSACDAPASGGGAAPPRVGNAALQAEVDALLAPPGRKAWQPADALALREALCSAGLWRHPALDAALASHGLSRKRIEALAPLPTGAGATAASAVVNPRSQRRVPPRE